MAARLRRSLRSGVALALGALVAACVQDDGERFNPLRSISEVSAEQEREIGAAVDAQIREVLTLVDDPVVLGFVNDLGQQLVAKVEPQPFLYRFRVIVDPSLNAFAIPGGYIYLHSGTVLAAASVDELAGVLAHEVAHVKARHSARRQEQGAVPALLTQLAGLAATVATGEGGFLMVAQGVNVALQLSYTREMEREADEIGISLMRRTGHDPLGMARFFERILAERSPGMGRLPAYLYSHPDVEDRVEHVRQRVRGLEPTLPAPDGESARREAQARLALLVETGRSTWHGTLASYDRTRSDPLLAQAAVRAKAGELERALESLAEAGELEPADPRVPFERGELLGRDGRLREAIAEYRSALALDPTVALPYLRLGDAHRKLGDRHSAVFYLEQAAQRSAAGGELRRRAERAIEALTFPPVQESGLASRESLESHQRGPLPSSDRFGSATGELVWWAQLRKRWLDKRDEITLRWTDPSGHLAAETPSERGRRPQVVSRLALAGELAGRVGIWRVEAILEGDVIDRKTFHLIP